MEKVHRPITPIYHQEEEETQDRTDLFLFSFLLLFFQVIACESLSIISHVPQGPSSFVLLLSSNSFKNLSLFPLPLFLLFSHPPSLIFGFSAYSSSSATMAVQIRLYLLLLLLLLTNGLLCFGDYKVLNLFAISGTENGTTILEMKHRDQCSNETISDRNKKMEKRLIMDDLRVRSLQSRIKTMISGVTTSTNSEIPLNSGITLDTLNYIVQVGIGGRNLTVIVDTGSDLTWVQCQPCNSCYTQQDPLLNPPMSHSYQPILCNSSTCLSFQSGTCGGSEPPICSYDVSYGDGSYTRGDLATESLNLGAARFNNFVFGCGRSNRGLFGGASGLMGLGKSDVSLVSQTFALFGGVFSYCLPNTDTQTSGSLVLGGGNSSVFKNSTPISYTDMIKNPSMSGFYLLNMTGISIGGTALQIPKSDMLIDSGTVITRLPPSIYNALKGEFLKQFSGFPPASGFSILDTCFNLSGFQEVNIPSVKIQFDGDAELGVDVTGIFYFVKADASQVCLALASLLYEDEIGIIGNFQQKNQRVVYDTKESKLGFAGEMCSF